MMLRHCILTAAFIINSV